MRFGETGLRREHPRRSIQASVRLRRRKHANGSDVRRRGVCRSRSAEASGGKRPPHGRPGPEAADDDPAGRVVERHEKRSTMDVVDVVVVVVVVGKYSVMTLLFTKC
jgi:hypothetical protein